MIERIVFLPCAHLLDSAVASGAAHELDELRSVIDRVVGAAIKLSNAVTLLGSEAGVEVGEYLVGRITTNVSIKRLRLGSTLQEPTSATSLIVMGDGSAKRTEKAPGYIDDRAMSFDSQVQQIFEDSSLDQLANLDPKLGQELWVAGVEPWRTVGSWVEESGSQWKLQEFHFEDPYGVAYFVASFARLPE